jgi:hypothetical protein
VRTLAYVAVPAMVFFAAACSRPSDKGEERIDFAEVSVRGQDSLRNTVRLHDRLDSLAAMSRPASYQTLRQRVAALQDLSLQIPEGSLARSTRDSLLADVDSLHVAAIALQSLTDRRARDSLSRLVTILKGSYAERASARSADSSLSQAEDSDSHAMAVGLSALRRTLPVQYARIAAQLTLNRAQQLQQYQATVAAGDVARVSSACGAVGAVRGNLFGRIWIDGVVPGRDVTDLSGAAVVLEMVSAAPGSIRQGVAAKVENSWFEFQDLPDTGRFVLLLYDTRLQTDGVPLLVHDVGDLSDQQDRCIDARASLRPVPMVRRK